MLDLGQIHRSQKSKNIKMQNFKKVYFYRLFVCKNNCAQNLRGVFALHQLINLHHTFCINIKKSIKQCYFSFIQLFEILDLLDCPP